MNAFTRVAIPAYSVAGLLLPAQIFVGDNIPCAVYHAYLGLAAPMIICLSFARLWLLHFRFKLAVAIRASTQQQYKSLDLHQLPGSGSDAAAAATVDALGLAARSSRKLVRGKSAIHVLNSSWYVRNRRFIKSSVVGLAVTVATLSMSSSYMFVLWLVFPDAFRAGTTMFDESCPFAGNIVEMVMVLCGGASVCLAAVLVKDVHESLYIKVRGQRCCCPLLRFAGCDIVRDRVPGSLLADRDVAAGWAGHRWRGAVHDDLPRAGSVAHSLDLLLDPGNCLERSAAGIATGFACHALSVHCLTMSLLAGSVLRSFCRIVITTAPLPARARALA
jgi:hypothetical protein